MPDRKQRELFAKVLGNCARCYKHKVEEGKTICFFCSRKNTIYTRKLIVKIYDKYGGRKCICCGVAFLEFLTTNHVNNNGAEHRRKLGKSGRLHIHRYLRDENYPEGEYNVMCIACNQAYGHYGRCFHQDGIGILDNLDKISEDARYHRRLKRDVINHYGGECVCCGEKNLMFLEMNHIDGGGREHFRQLGNPGSFYRWIKANNFPPIINVMCANCNFSLGMYGYCPHNSDNRGK